MKNILSSLYWRAYWILQWFNYKNWDVEVNNPHCKRYGYSYCYYDGPIHQFSIWPFVFTVYPWGKK